MLDLPSDIDGLLLYCLIAISITLLVLSVLTAIGLSVRRVFRNRRTQKTAHHQAEFEAFLQELLAIRNFPKNYQLRNEVLQNHVAIVAGLLKFFRIVKGEDRHRLRIIVDRLQLEPIIVKAVRKGNRGKRMRALNVLSFLESQSSLRTISEDLYSDDKYIRLTVARCLARRQTLSLVSEVSHAVSGAFPKDEKLITEVLIRFGNKAIPQIEDMARSAKSGTIIAGALESLILLQPPKCSLDLDTLMDHPDERVRSAVVILSRQCEHDAKQDLLARGLSDETRKVKIRSIKLAMREQDSKYFSHLYHLMKDPFLWVRYWAMRAAIKSGQSGKFLMQSLARRNGSEGELARDVMFESGV